MPNLLEIVENILKNRALESINLAKKAGVLVSGFDKVKEKPGAGKIAFVIEELDKALNRTNTVHAALLKSEMAQMTYNQLQRWQNFINS